MQHIIEPKERELYMGRPQMYKYVKYTIFDS